MFYDFKSGLKQQDSLEPLRQAFGGDAPSRETVYNWFTEFRRHRETLEDGERTGRPCSATIEENVTAVRGETGGRRCPSHDCLDCRSAADFAEDSHLHS